MNPAYKYMVLTEEGSAVHLVAIKSLAETPWVKIVAAFENLERAKSYAEVENILLEDNDFPASGKLEDPPEAGEHGSRLGTVMAGLSRPRDVRPSPSLLGLAKPPRALAQEIAEALPDLMDLLPLGATCRQLAEWSGAEEPQVRQAMRQIERMGLGRLVRRRDSSSIHLCPPDYVSPPEALTDRQARLLRAIQTAQNGETAEISIVTMARLANIAKGSVVQILDALIRKGRVEQVRARRPGATSSYIVKNPLSADEKTGADSGA